MKIIFTLLFIGFTLTSCSQDLKDNFPSEIKTIKTNQHERIEGTKIFAKIPKDFKFIQNLVRYQKESDLYIQFIETNTSNFYKAKPNFTREEIESKGAKVDILKDVKFNSLDAVFGDGPSKESNERKTLFVFGDDEFIVIAVGIYPKNNLEGRNEILGIFENLVYEKKIKLDPLELANFKFDQSITGFKYASTMSNMFAFTEDGIPEAIGEFSTSMNIAAMPKMSIEKSHEFIRSIIHNAKNSGNEIKISEIKTTKIGEYSASLLETEMVVEKKKGIFYAVMLNGESSSVFFMGAAFERKPELLKKYKETVKTIIIN